MSCIFWRRWKIVVGWNGHELNTHRLGITSTQRETGGSRVCIYECRVSSVWFNVGGTVGGPCVSSSLQQAAAQQQQYYPRPNGYTISYSIKLIINSDPPSEDICPNYSRCLPTVLSEVLQGIVLCILLTRCEVEHNNESHNPKWITHIFFLLGPRWYWVFTMMIKIWWQDAYGSPQLQRTFCPRRTFCPPQERTSS